MNDLTHSHPDDPASHPDDPASHPGDPASHPGDPAGTRAGDCAARPTPAANASAPGPAHSPHDPFDGLRQEFDSGIRRLPYNPVTDPRSPAQKDRDDAIIQRALDYALDLPTDPAIPLPPPIHPVRAAYAPFIHDPYDAQTTSDAFAPAPDHVAPNTPAAHAHTPGQDRMPSLSSREQGTERTHSDPATPTASPIADSANLDPLPAHAPAWDGAAPLRTRVWLAFCAGGTPASIARDLHLDRQTATRYIHAVQAELAETDHATLLAAQQQAVHAQLAIQRAAWAAYQEEVTIEADYRAAYQHAQLSAVRASPRSKLDPDWLPTASRPATTSCAEAPYRAQRARLLTLASNAAWRAAQLYGLPQPPAPQPPSAPPASPTSPASPTLPTHMPVPNTSGEPTPPPCAPASSGLAPTACAPAASGLAPTACAPAAVPACLCASHAPDQHPATAVSPRAAFPTAPDAVPVAVPNTKSCGRLEI